MVLVFLALGSASWATSRDTLPHGVLKLADLRVVNLTGDPVIKEETADSLFRRLLEREEFVAPGKAYGITDEGFRLQNPFYQTTTAESTLRMVSVRLVLEESYYGEPVDPKASNPELA